MKIAQITATFPPYMSGTGNVCYHNSIELANLGHDVTIFTSTFYGENFKFNKSIKVVRFRPIIQIGNASLLPKLLLLKKFDIVHLHYPFVFGAELIFLNSLIKKNKVITTYHQDMIFHNVFDMFLKGYNRFFGNHLLLHSKKIIVPTLDYALHSSIKNIIETHKLDVVEVPNGVDIEKFRPKISYKKIKEIYHFTDQKIILFVGALDKAHYFKRVDVLIKAFSKLKNKHTILLIVGDGDLKKTYINLAKECMVSERVIFAGRVTENNLPQYYAMCDLLVLPSDTGGEIFGLVLVEAMACGKPVIASNLPGVRTVVDNEKTGLLVKPGDIVDLSNKIDYILENQIFAKRIGEAGRTKVEQKYSWNAIGKKLEEIYMGVLSL